MNIIYLFRTCGYVTLGQSINYTPYKPLWLTHCIRLRDDGENPNTDNNYLGSHSLNLDYSDFSLCVLYNFKILF